MNLQTVPMRDGQTLQCAECLKMATVVWADLDGPAYASYYCLPCVTDKFIRAKLTTEGA